MVDSSFYGVVLVSIAGLLAVNYAVLFLVVRAAIKSARPKRRTGA